MSSSHKKEAHPEGAEKQINAVWRKWLPVLIAFVWVLGFYVWFYSQTLPNAQQLADGTRPDRWLIWEFVPQVLLDDLLPIREKNAAPAGLAYLPQRIPFLLIATFIYGLAYCLGTGLFHALGLKIRNIGRAEWHGLSLAVGLSGLSLITLGLGLLGGLNRIAFGIVYLLILLFWAVMHARSHGGFSAWMSRMKAWILLQNHKLSQRTFTLNSVRIWGTIVLVPFLIAIFLGAMLPSVDFDVKEYHFGGPKEFYQSGSIHMLPHNVYTSFPFLTEMFTLTGMVLYADWYWGALAGKAILAGFAPLTALLVYTIIRRSTTPTAGWLGAIIYLTIPWTYRISIIAYTEGGLCLYVAATLLAAMVAISLLKKKTTPTRWFLVTGLLAGSAISCKYPGLISVTLPISLFLLGAYALAVKAGERKPMELLSGAGMFVLGTVITFGPWMAKNMAETGNPVYPLAYSVLGGADWDDTMNIKWKAAHSPDHHQLSHFFTSVVDVFVVNDWQSPLILGFGLIGIVVGIRSSSKERWVSLYLLWLLVSWWVLTHRIDRFWVPLLPVGACLAGWGAWWIMQRTRIGLIALLFPAIIFNLAFITLELCGYNAYVIDLNAARKITANITSPEVVFLNELIKNKEGAVLSVGEAELFDATFPYRYNTVFDRSLLAEWMGIVDRDIPEGEWQNKSTEDIRKIFTENEFSYVLVNWQEILRYRTTYKYTDFVTPERFQQLQEMGILGEALANTPFYQPYDSLSDTQRKEIERWAPSLIVEINGERYFVTTQIFPVLPE